MYRDILKQDLYHRFSGKFHPGKLPLAFLGVTAILFVGAFIYSAGVHYIPFIYFNLLLTLGFAVLAGAAAVWVSRWGHNRNKMLAMAMGLASGVMALWFIWSFWLFWMLIGSREISFFNWHNINCFNPYNIIRVAIQVMHADNYMTIGNNLDITGYGLAGLWCIEGLIILSGSVFGILGALSNLLYCEECRKWLATGWISQPLLLPDGDENTVALKESLEEHQFAMLTAHDPVTDPGEPYLSVQLSTCPCGRTTLLNVLAMEPKIDSEGNYSFKSTPLLRHLRLSPEEAEKLKTTLPELK